MTRALRHLVLALVAAASLATAAVAADGPRETVQSMIDQVLAILRDDSASSAAKRERLEQVVYAHVDFPTVSRLVLARHWGDFSPEQQDAFVREFKRHLSLTYGSNVERYRNEGIVITGAREEARGDSTVLTKVQRGGGAADVEMNYRLRQIDGAWKGIDVIIENVSLVANYRSQFQDMLSGGSPAKLLAALEEKNAKGQPLKAPGA
jgi:phospholipid transport system substrate-binding protein